MKNQHYNVIQSCITNVSFPQDIENLRKLIRKNKGYNLDFNTDLDFLLNFDNIKSCMPDLEYHYWTAPKWFTKGDILLFYYGSTSLQRARSMLRWAKIEFPDDLELINTIKHSIKLGEKYSGKIFGCTSIINTPQYLTDENDEQHFGSTIFAPFNEVHLFKNPLHKKEFDDYVNISNHGALSPISNKEGYENLKSLLSKNNDLPDYFKYSKLGDIGFKDLDKTNWFEISCSDEACFIHEVQIRAYLIDYLLNELKDNRTALLEECECYKENKLSGRVDYFIKLDSNWIPVEAKLNTLAEKNLTSQINKYVGIDYFTPTKNPNKGKIYDMDQCNFCIIVDQLGIYLYNNHQFINCEPGKPLWSKKEFNDTNKIRKQLIEILNRF